MSESNLINTKFDKQFFYIKVEYLPNNQFTFILHLASKQIHSIEKIALIS